MTPVVIYLHGFLSSPASIKAQASIEYVRSSAPDIELVVPKISNYPQQAISQLHQIAREYQGRIAGFIGSSMGGYLSTFLRESYGGKAVLINPAVNPDKLLQDYLGEHINPYTQEVFTLTQQHADAIAQVKVAELTQPQDYWVLLQTGDETLDYREAEKKYSCSKLTIEQGGDHSFQGYERFLPEIFSFLLERCD